VEKEDNDMLEMMVMPRKCVIKYLWRNLKSGIVLLKTSGFKFPDSLGAPTQNQLTNKPTFVWQKDRMIKNFSI
jgi:hypothetical protein